VNAVELLKLLTPDAKVLCFYVKTFIYTETIGYPALYSKLFSDYSFALRVQYKVFCLFYHFEVLFYSSILKIYDTTDTVDERYTVKKIGRAVPQTLRYFPNITHVYKKYG
jgi:hypothetical protein